MSSPSKKKPEALPPDIQVEESSASGTQQAEPTLMDLQDTGKNVKKQLLRSPDTSPSRSPQPKTPSTSPIRNFLHRLRETIPRSFHPEMTACAKSSTSSTEAEEYPVIRLQPQKWNDVLESKNTTNLNDIQLQPARTHLDSLLIRNSQCFLVAARKAAKYQKECQEFLGVIVRFKNKKCIKDDCPKCPACQVCSCLFQCTCNPKLGKVWCPHVHVMQELTGGVYEKKALLFIQLSWNFTPLRHLRAVILGRNKMAYENGIWVEQFESLWRNEVYRVTQNTVEDCTCPSVKKCELCNACICKFNCTCEDFGEYMQVCEHIHCVSMKKNEMLFDNMTQLIEVLRRTHGKAEDHEMEKDLNSRFFNEYEHAMADYINVHEDDMNKRTLQHVQSATTWIFAHKGCSPDIIKVAQRKDLTNRCYCYEPNKKTKTNVCLYCKICNYHFECNCPIGQSPILCRHKHFIMRFERKIQIDSYADRAKQVKDVLSWYNDLTSLELTAMPNITCPPMPEELPQQSYQLDAEVEEIIEQLFRQLI